MEKEYTFGDNGKGRVKINYLPCLNYAMILNNGMAFNEFTITNQSESDAWRNVRVSISGDLLENCDITLDTISQGVTASLDEAMLMPQAAKLMTLTEAVQTTFDICIYVEGQLVSKQTFPLMLLAIDQWTGTSIRPELLAAFVTPNHPILASVCRRASELLESYSGSKALDEYQSQDEQQVLWQIKSIYEALQEQELIYAAVPPSFEEYGQRIRLVDKVLNEKMGNCLDLSLLLCSCLESIGIRTQIVIYHGHAFMAAWVNPCRTVPMVDYSIDNLVDSLFYGDMIAIEATDLTGDSDFETAVEDGKKHIELEGADFEMAVDIYRCRCERIRPIPQCVHQDGVWTVKDDIDYDAIFDEMSRKNPYDIQGSAFAEKLRNKQLLWERKLLDLSLRNNLLNMKASSMLLPLTGMAVNDVLTSLDAETLIDSIDQKKWLDTIKALYRAARTSLEESGANTLFLSIGTMQWYEAEGHKAYRAPVIFIPIEIVRHGAKKYLIRPRDEEVMVNITLVEMMRQMFDLQVPDFSQFDADEEGNIDWARILGVLRTSIEEVNLKRPENEHWEVLEDCNIGIFSFSKFVMWHDIHENPDALKRQPLLRSLIEGHSVMDNGVSEVSARELDKKARPADFAIPIDVDSSQLEAIVNSGAGRSFILHGPPGTGKSQTITNMIANALYHDKRVLFVAEKKAALEVVQDRLKKIGIDPFCLELHSNKVDKKSFIAQMDDAVNVEKKDSIEVFRKKSDTLYEHRSKLNAYVEALHKKRPCGLSLYELINLYLEIGDKTQEVDYADVASLSKDDVKVISDECLSLDTISSILGVHPGLHPLLGLLPRENTAENQQAVVEALKGVAEAIRRSRRKEQGLWNRWFSHRSALEILFRSNEWQDLMEVAEVEDDRTEDIDSLEKSVELWTKNASRLRQWYHFSLQWLKVKGFSVPTIPPYYISGHTGRETADSFRKGYYEAMIRHTIDNDPVLRMFNGMLFEDIIKRYRELTREFQELTKEELIARLSQRVPQPSDPDKTIREELALLHKRITNKGRGTSVRRIISQTSHILPRLCPCMLMSPLSVAQYLDMNAEPFDLVIFDEASQMPTSEAVGAIARGKAVVVVGDPKQMPPTSFFMTTNTTDGEADIDDLESILDDCISMCLPNLYLSWHYRSRHESLIAFSNTHFYDGRLTTFPSVDERERKVTLQQVEGFYDFGKSRCNKAEAKAIVAETLERLRRKDGMSIGIIAFSKVQSNLIEDMLMDALSKDKELEAIAQNEKEPIFVKNLENVQGDERDVILFSVGYGPDKDGKVSMNFGPLNQTGGERRLNVAVTRARCEMKVFSTLRPHQIDLQRSNAFGVVALKRFLEYAETGVLPVPSSQITVNEADAFTREVAKRLSDMGYKTKVNVGLSQFKIDVAIADSDDPMRHRVGIILDGPNYYATPTARDREIVRPDVLTNLGWEIRHVWSEDWIENPTLVMKALAPTLICGRENIQNGEVNG